MTKKTQIQRIQKRLPDDIVIIDETQFDVFTEDEFVSILCWLKLFRIHYAEFGKSKLPMMIFPIISKRLRLDFGLYHIPNDREPRIGQHNVYLTENNNYSKRRTVKYLVQAWSL